METVAEFLKRKGIDPTTLPNELTDQLTNSTRREIGFPPKSLKEQAAPTLLPKKRRGEFAILRHKTGDFEVRILARSEGYAMVRRKGAAPFVVSERDLEPNAQLTGAAPTNETGGTT